MNQRGNVEGQASLFNERDFLNYRIVRSKNRKRTMTLKVERNGTIVILVPEKTPTGEIKRFFASKVPWISRKLKEYRELIGKTGGPRRYETGEKFLYLGQEYPLEVVEGNKARLSLYRGVFRLCNDHDADGGEMFRAWYRERARQIFPERVAFYGRRLDLAWKGIRITGARTRYGSCSGDNRLSFSFRLVMAPYDVIDYIVVHELAHIKIKNHSKRFWEYIGKVMPDYKRRKEWLSTKGFLLEI
jgi:predicted metal-dependent hydrolase